MKCKGLDQNKVYDVCMCVNGSGEGIIFSQPGDKE